MPRVPRIAPRHAPTIEALLTSAMPFRACSFCDDAAMPGRTVCVRHASSDGGSYISCAICRAPVDRILGELATEIDRLCDACAFRAKSRVAMKRKGEFTCSL